MASGAAHLVDHVLPLVADYRQWTLSFPRWLRIRLLRDKALVSEVLLVFVRVVSADHRRRARARGVAGGETGAVTAIQLAGSFANANVHFHTLVPEGVWHELPDGSLGFHPLPPPTDEDVEAIAVRIGGRVARLSHVGEVKAMRWREDVDMIAKTITVNFQIRNGETTTPKGRTRRTVPMTETLHAALKRMSTIRTGLVVRTRRDRDAGQLRRPGTRADLPARRLAGSLLAHTSSRLQEPTPLCLA